MPSRLIIICRSVLQYPMYLRTAILLYFLWSKQTILIVLRQLYCCAAAFLVVRKPHFCEAVALLWGSLILVRQQHCCKAASLIWGRLIVVSYPHCYEVASLLWGSLIAVRQPHCCETASLLWGRLIAASLLWWRLLLWGHLIYWGIHCDI